ncbi:MAG: F0F1 ATP synthase subunit A [Planctomycetales bacterium]|nr:F0F1 ATP synthase subunit A [Planctomycetales bacterium]
MSANPLLHIKDAYYFEVPRAWYPSDRETREDFPPHYIRLDPDYQNWEADRQYDGLAKLGDLEGLPAKEALLSQYEAWRHEASNFAAPFDRFLEESSTQAWFQKQLCLGKYSRKLKDETDEQWSLRQGASEQLISEWRTVKAEAENLEAYSKTPGWSPEKIAQYNEELNGKIIIPQPFGKLRNNYEKESGFCISKFMILEVLVAAILIVVFKKLADRITHGRVPKGKLWNMFEAFLLFIRNDIARPAIGAHDADKFVPILWTMFMFILGCNLLGMLPWLGAPTGSFSVTLAMAAVTFGTGLWFGSKKFGFVGYWKNQVPHMELPTVIAIFIVPMLFLIEVLGLLIKHMVLGIRLLANMVAGHLVLLAIMGIAVSAGAAAAAGSDSSYWIPAVISVLGSAIFSCLELFVAFLQAYVFTFLSALFIGAAVHHH